MIAPIESILPGDVLVFNLDRRRRRTVRVIEMDTDSEGNENLTVKCRNGYWMNQFDTGDWEAYRNKVLLRA